MIGRGSYGRPWFLNQVDHYLKTGESLPDPCLKTQKQLALNHFWDMIDHHGDFQGVRHARKHLSWYSKGLAGSAEFRVSINRLESPQAVADFVSAFYDELICVA
jgi:tRNA-dihydrouridine synthase B